MIISYKDIAKQHNRNFVIGALRMLIETNVLPIGANNLHSLAYEIVQYYYENLGTRIVRGQTRLAVWVGCIIDVVGYYGISLDPNHVCDKYEINSSVYNGVRRKYF